jgi:N-acetylmuramoyl-L-alanine amidase
MRTAAEAIERLRDPAPPTGRPVSSHYVVDEDGAVFRLVPEDRRAWHAGVSFWRGATALNGRSIGIEIVNPGHEFGYRDFPAVQMAAVLELCRSVLERHGIPARNVVGHSDVAPDRKQDPGERFDWGWLAERGVGLRLNGDDPADPGDDARALLERIGYDASVEAVALAAFQRRWLPQAVTGLADPATMRRLAAVARAAEA